MLTKIKVKSEHPEKRSNNRWLPRAADALFVVPSFRF
jgi:hypothetical protein